MSDAGYVYILENISIENMVKIGKTTREPKERAKELSTTGVPTPFTVAYSCYFMNCSEAERLIHKYLENNDQRVSTRREFFKISTVEAISAVQMATRNLETGYDSMSYGYNTKVNHIDKKSNAINRSLEKSDYYKSSVNLKYTSINELFNKQDIKYEEINNKITSVMKSHIDKLIQMKITSKIETQYMLDLENYIENNLENKLLEINNIKDYYKTFDEILTIVYMIVASYYQPELYKFNYFNGYLNSQELTIKIQDIINEHKIELLHSMKKYDWEYRRNIFFEKHIKSNLKNPKIALHKLFEKICEDELKIH